MKIYITLILLFLLFCKTHAQEGGGELGWMEMEIFMMTTGLYQGETVRYKLEAMGTVWRSENTAPPSGYEFSNDHNLAYYPILTEPATGNTNFNDLNTIWGYNWMQPFIVYEHSYDSIAHGLYKVSISPGDQYFYLDYRDDRYNWSTVYTQAPGGLDIWILYNKNLNRFMYRKQGSINPDPQYWTLVEKGDFIGLWTIKEVGNPTTGYFPDFWTNCLSVGDDGHNHPRLIWGRHPFDGVNFGVEEYKIYRAITKRESDDYIQFTHIASVSGDVFNYIDFNAEINPSSVYKLHYKVTATYNNNQESIYETSPTNTVWVFGSLYKKSGSLTEAGYILLYQNYPNPFNPSTIIMYSIPNKERVTVKVFDVFGREVTTLEDGYKESGSYQIEFNGEELASGVYFYRLNIGNYVKTGKMILQK